MKIRNIVQNLLLAFFGLGGLMTTDKTFAGNSIENISNSKETTLVIDDECVRFSTPLGGEKGRSNRYRINTHKSEEATIVLYTHKYDRISSFTKNYCLTHYLVGIAREGCCDLDGIETFLAEDERRIGKGVVSIGEHNFYKAEAKSDAEEYVYIYYLPYNENYNLFFSLALSEELLRKDEIVQTRAEIMKDILGSLKVENCEKSRE